MNYITLFYPTTILIFYWKLWQFFLATYHYLVIYSLTNPGNFCSHTVFYVWVYLNLSSPNYTILYLCLLVEYFLGRREERLEFGFIKLLSHICLSIQYLSLNLSYLCYIQIQNLPINSRWCMINNITKHSSSIPPRLILMVKELISILQICMSYWGFGVPHDLKIRL